MFGIFNDAKIKEKVDEVCRYWFNWKTNDSKPLYGGKSFSLDMVNMFKAQLAKLASMTPEREEVAKIIAESRYHKPWCSLGENQQEDALYHADQICALFTARLEEAKKAVAKEAREAGGEEQELKEILEKDFGSSERYEEYTEEVAEEIYLKVIKPRIDYLTEALKILRTEVAEEIKRKLEKHLIDDGCEGWYIRYTKSQWRDFWGY